MRVSSVSVPEQSLPGRAFPVARPRDFPVPSAVPAPGQRCLRAVSPLFMPRFIPVREQGWFGVDSGRERDGTGQTPAQPLPGKQEKWLRGRMVLPLNLFTFAGV